ADTLTPRLARLHLTPPPKAYPGLIVRRDGVDVTPLVGTKQPIDPGDHEIAVTAPGFVEWKTKITIAGEGTVQDLAIPELAAAPIQAATEAHPPRTATDSELSITTPR